MITNGDITIFNKAYDRETRSELFVPTIIRGVHVFNRVKGKGELQQEKSFSCQIRIPIDANTGGKEYVSQHGWIAAGDKSGLWTIQLGDVVVLRAVEEDALRNETELLRKYLEAVVVSTVTDNTTIGSKAVRHWRIGGV